MVDGEESELEAGGNAQLVENIGEVALDGLLADGEFLRDVPIVVAGDDGGDDFEFARGEP